jgi:transposase
VHTSATKCSTDFIDLLDQLGAAYSTAERARPLVAVLDNGPIHTSKLTTKALAARPWLTLEWLPKYAPELNHIERCWLDLLRKSGEFPMSYEELDDPTATVYEGI